jgi:putative heme-binding domain-containing protein
LELAAQSDRSAELRKAALAKVVGNVGPRGGWGAMLRQPRFGQTLEKLLDDDQMSGDALAAIDELRLRSLGDQVLAKAQDANLGPAARKRAIRAASHLQPTGAADAFRKLLADSRPDIAGAAISGLVDLQDIRSLREIMSGETTSSELQRRAADRLVDSTAGAILLLRLIDEGKLSDELKQAVVAKANAHPDANVRVLYEKFIPEDERPQKLGGAIAADDILALNGDANRGRNIFFKSSAAQCNQCHAVNGFGNTLGPELTNIGKKYERKALLETILLPSKAIGPEYVPYVLETSSGQVYAGFLVEKTDQQVVLRDVKNQVIRVPAEEVEALVQQQKSLMPELVLSQVTAQDAADLLAFLESLK